MKHSCSLQKYVFFKGKHQVSKVTDRWHCLLCKLQGIEKCQREEHCKTILVKLRKYVDTNPKIGEKKDQLLSDDTHPMKNFKIDLKNSFIDGAKNLIIYEIEIKSVEMCFLFKKKALDY